MRIVLEGDFKFYFKGGGEVLERKSLFNYEKVIIFVVIFDNF